MIPVLVAINLVATSPCDVAKATAGAWEQIARSNTSVEVSISAQMEADLRDVICAQKQETE